ncbi:MAG: hypothetical protein LBM04_06750, partial [Opitutaceae bacterium]|nr:hypothetical protein [Opitutaceae bacterium]
LTLSIDFFAYDFPMTRLAQTNNPIATKNTKRALCVCDHQQSADRRCGLLSCKIIFCRKPVRGAYKRPENVHMRGVFFCVFCGNWIVGLGLFLWLRLRRAVPSVVN